MKKDLKEAILGIEVTQFDGQKADLEELVNPNQLEEIIDDWVPEVLSDEWIDENKKDSCVHYIGYYVPIGRLRDLLVPKQEITLEQAYDKLRGESTLTEKSFDYYWNCISDNVEIDEPEVTLDKAFEKVAESYSVPKEEVWRHLEQLEAHGGKVTYDEPEVLSQEWINEHSYNVHFLGTPDVETVAIPREDLENLLVPKEELPVIPKFVADYLDFAKSDVSLMRVMEIAYTRNEWLKWKKEYNWISANDEKFARAWLDGYTVKKEQKYYARIKGWENVTTGSESFNWVYFKETDAVGISKAVENKYQSVSFTKKDWNNLGINEHNADFVLVEELEE